MPDLYTYWHCGVCGTKGFFNSSEDAQNDLYEHQTLCWARHKFNIAFDEIITVYDDKVEVNA